MSTIERNGATTPCPSTSDGSVDLAALPVSLAMPRALSEQVQRHLEAALGWQVTAGEGLRPRLCLTAVSSTPTRRPSGGLPTILLVSPQDSPAAAASAGAHVDAVLPWPDGVDELPVVASLLLDQRREAGLPTIRLAGASGGVGTTTVALALGGLLAWQARSVLLASSSDLAVPEVPTINTLEGPRPWEVAAHVPGVDGLRCARVGGHAVPAVVGPDLLLLDGPDDAPHVLVAATDRAGLQAVEAATGAVVLVARGPLPTNRFQRTGARIAAVLPWSARVARAGALARVPASLPGTWLRQLAPLAQVIGRDLGPRGDRSGRPSAASGGLSTGG